MAYANFLVPMEGGEVETRLNQFLAQHAVLKIEERFVEEDGKAHWAYRVRYQAGSPSAVESSRPMAENTNRPNGIDYMETLKPEDGGLYLKLKDWRKKRADEEGSVPFAIFTNAMLAAIAEQRPTSLEALRKIKGVGEGRVEKYGAEVLAMVGDVGAKS